MFFGDLRSFFIIFRRFFVSWALLARLGCVLVFGGRFVSILQRFRKVLGGFGEGFGEVFASIFCILIENADFVKNCVLPRENQ